MRWLIVLVLAALPAAAQDTKKKKVVLPPDSMYALKCKTLEGKDADLSENAGKVALVVNLASQ